MSHARRYHEPGVGSRTGMRMADGALDLDEFFQAGRRALIGSARSSVASRRSSISSIASNSSRASAEVGRRVNGQSVVGNSSVMVIEQSPAPSPRSTLRRSAYGVNTSTAESFAFDRTQLRSSDIADANNVSAVSRRRTPRKEMLPEADGLYSDRRTSDVKRMSVIGPHNKQGRSSQATWPSSPSPTTQNGNSSLRRHGLSVGLNARRLAREKQAQKPATQDVSRGSTHKDSTQRTSLVLEEDVRANVSVASWPSPSNSANDLQDAAYGDVEEDMVAFDGTDMSHSRPMSLASVEEEEIPGGSMELLESHDGRGDKDDMEPIVESDASVDEAEEDEEDQTAMTEEDSRHSAADNYSAAPSESDGDIDDDMSEEEEEATITVDQTVSDTADGIQYDYDDHDDRENDDASTAGESHIHDDDVSAHGYSSTTSVTRSVLSEKNSNVAVESKKRQTKSKRSWADDDDQATPKARKRAVPSKEVDGRVVERIPSSYHRRDFAAAQQQDEDDGSGVRRGTRYRFKPLEYWRGERARYGRMSLPKNKEQRNDTDGATVGDDTIDADAFEDSVLAIPPPVVVLKEIIRIPRAEGEGTFSGLKLPKKRDPNDKTSGARRGRGGSRDVSASVEPDPTQPNRYAEEGWDKETDTHASVLDVATGEERDVQVACTSNQLRPRMADGCSFGFEKVFVVEDFMATGVLFLLVDGEKPLKNSKDNFYTFTVLEGCVRVTLHKTQFTIAPQGMFFVPRGNDYSIRNISKRVARLAFTQAKRPNTTTMTRSDPSSA